MFLLNPGNKAQIDQKNNYNTINTKYAINHRDP
ncbi:MAG: hypothetical protein H6R41_403, partial [Deltaproteobacteria bacterium]|nr:hypothetical protein [Deltaproteobacteria bacterium]MBS1243866.1 hypothetical protein [Deltaproteobacteria bacterium]